MKELEFHPLADREHTRNINYFRHLGLKPVSEYVREVDDAIERARLYPQLGPPIYEHYRFLKLKTYRFTIFYRELRPGFVFVYAIAHDRRRPGYWLRRTRVK